MTRISQKTIDEIVAQVKLGVPAKTAAAAAGVPADTFEDWRTKGEKNGKGAWLFHRLFVALAEAEAEFEAKLAKSIVAAAAKGQWQAAAWLAERRFPDRYVRQSVNGREVIKASPDETLPASDKVAQIAEARESRRQRARRK